jgi:pyroglutamyl-peptidase
MSTRILITSFATWKNRQPSNTADQLLLDLRQQVAELEPLKAIAPLTFQFLRHLPVNVPIAAEMVLTEIERFQPHFIFLCGMAETRSHLSLETRATVCQESLYTRLDVAAIARGLPHTEVSHNAGRFVCNGLYYAVLKDLQMSGSAAQCLFVHVPQYRAQTGADFHCVLARCLTTQGDLQYF